MKATIRNRKGQSLVEAAVAAIFLIPVVLAIIDLAALVLCNTINDSIAKTAARAAASQKDQGNGQAAAQRVINDVATNPIIKSVALANAPQYSGPGGSVTVETKMEVQLPVTMLGMKNPIFIAKSVQPLLAQ